MMGGPAALAHDPERRVDEAYPVVVFDDLVEGSRPGLLSFFPQVLVVLGVIALWALVTGTHVVSSLVLPEPWSVVRALVDQPGMWASNAGVTLLEALLGYLCGNAAGVLLAILFVEVPPVGRGFLPLVLASQVVPVIAIAPVLVINFGHGLAPKVIVAAIIVFLPTLVNCTRGLQASAEESEELLFTLHASRLQRLTKVRFPAVLPYLIPAMRITACDAFAAAIIAEWTGAVSGLGNVIVVASTRFETPTVWAAVVLAAGISVLLFTAVSYLERHATPWKTPQIP